MDMNISSAGLAFFRQAQSEKRFQNSPGFAVSITAGAASAIRRPRDFEDA
jgi:hypothetical protein